MSKIYVIAFLVLPGFIFGQSTIDSVSTVHLSGLVISGSALKDAEVGLSEQSFDSAQMVAVAGMSIADLFRSNAGVQLRSYGSNGLSTPSMRGTGGNHTAVLWNGINLQSPLSGSQDLSLVPVAFIDDVSVQKGGSSSVYGSGAIGGTIQLKNEIGFGRGLELTTSQQVGSFGNYFQSYKASYGSSKFYSSSAVFKRTIDNNYAYINPYSNPERREIRTNAGFAQWGVLQQLGLKIDPQNQFDLKLWYQDNDLEIPTPIIANNESEAVQSDRFLRAMLDWSHKRNRWGLEYKSSINSHNLTFKPLAGDTAKNNYLNWVNRLVSTIDISQKSVLALNLNHTANHARVDAFGQEPRRQNITALHASYQFSSNDNLVRMAINIREEIVDGRLNPITPSLGVEIDVIRDVVVRSNVSRNYRNPTMNELYWRGSNAIGNPAIEAEDAYSIEAGLDWTAVEKSGWKVSAHGTLYHSLVDNWILWRERQVEVPGSSVRLWTPVNLKKVRSRGIESQIISTLNANRFKGKLTGNYSYTRTTNFEVFSDGNQNQVDNQLSYTPLHEASVVLSAQYQRFIMNTDHAYTSHQYTEADNRDRFALDAYQVTNVYFGYKTEWDKINADIGFRMNNILDVSYENRRGYPMYGRNYLIELKVSFKN